MGAGGRKSKQKRTYNNKFTNYYVVATKQSSSEVLKN